MVDLCADGCVEGCPVREMDEQSGVTVSKRSSRGVGLTSSTTYGAGRADFDTVRGHDDEGGASRFFPTFRYQAKAPSKERPGYVKAGHDSGTMGAKNTRECNACGSRAKPAGPLGDRPWPSCGHDDWSWVAERRETVTGKVAHPTVKPLALMRWLCRLITPPGGVVLDWCAGSGTTGEAALMEGFRAVLIEAEADYLPLIGERILRVPAAVVPAAVVPPTLAASPEPASPPQREAGGGPSLALF